MRRRRSGEENITERGQEMQDSDDLQAGRLESESSLRKTADKAPSSPEPSADPMQPGIDALENWLKSQKTQ